MGVFFTSIFQVTPDTLRPTPMELKQKNYIKQEGMIKKFFYKLSNRITNTENNLKSIFYRKMG